MEIGVFCNMSNLAVYHSSFALNIKFNSEKGCKHTNICKKKLAPRGLNQVAEESKTFY